MKNASLRVPDNGFPLPSWEGIKGRGKHIIFLMLAVFSTPTLTLPHQGGGIYGERDYATSCPVKFQRGETGERSSAIKAFPGVIQRLWRRTYEHSARF
jgi:hypothetical protein